MSDQDNSQPDPMQERLRQGDADHEDTGRREFIGRSGKLLIYAPPLIQLFIPTKAMAASPSGPPS